MPATKLKLHQENATACNSLCQRATAISSYHQLIVQLRVTDTALRKSAPNGGSRQLLAGRPRGVSHPAHGAAAKARAVAREAAQMRPVQRQLRPVRPPGRAQADAHRRKAIPVRPVRRGLCAVKRASETQANAHGREAVQVRSLRRCLPSLQPSGRTHTQAPPPKLSSHNSPILLPQRLHPRPLPVFGYARVGWKPGQSRPRCRSHSLRPALFTSCSSSDGAGTRARSRTSVISAMQLS